MVAAHKPVLYQEIISLLNPASRGRYVDGTLGAGGHAAGIMAASEPDGQLLGLDVDPAALAIGAVNLARFGPRVVLMKASYATLERQLDAIGWKGVNGILVDLGVSSMQLDIPERGFSFQAEAPLDMRFDPSDSITAADLVNNLSERELADIIYRYGEEPLSRPIARAIVNARPIDTTDQLAAVVAKAVQGRHPERHGRAGISGKKDLHSREEMGRKTIHPATLTFQALRIAVNRELENLESFLPQAVAALVPGGRLAVIAFHSLEDRIVKIYFRRESQDCLCPPRQPVCTCGHKATISEVTRRPIRPQPGEVQENPRARSARLRVAQKLAEVS